MQWIRTNPERLKEELRQRNHPFQVVDSLLAMDESRRKKIGIVEQLKERRNTVSQEVGRFKKIKKDTEALVTEMRQTGQDIKALDDEIRQIDEQLLNMLLSVPNVPHTSVPIGPDETYNREERRVGTPPVFDFEPQPHWVLGEALGILDFERAGKVAGARFTFYRGLGAKLERALIGFMLDLHINQHYYTELMPPLMVNESSMTGTGQLPKFAEDMFRIENNGYYLIPTAEVPLTNYYREDILDGASLPIYLTAYTPCFRAEAGSAGKDTRGLIRQHQFNKVELVKFVLPEDSYQELETLTQAAERVLQLLELPYRVICLCTGDMGFGSAKTYDLEVWMPGAGTYREISSCSNFEDFQARRANIRFRRNPKEKLEFVHTLNGSALAIGRTTAAILENFQNSDGAVRIPKALQPYMGTDIIKRKEEKK
jgi:seryl-tRNA synthetase